MALSFFIFVLSPAWLAPVCQRLLNSNVSQTEPLNPLILCRESALSYHYYPSESHKFLSKVCLKTQRNPEYQEMRPNFLNKAAVNKKVMNSLLNTKTAETFGIKWPLFQRWLMAYLTNLICHASPTKSLDFRTLKQTSVLHLKERLVIYRKNDKIVKILRLTYCLSISGSFFFFFFFYTEQFQDQNWDPSHELPLAICPSDGVPIYCWDSIPCSAEKRLIYGIAFFFFFFLGKRLICGIES